MYGLVGMDLRMESIIKYMVSQHNIKEEDELRHYS